MGFYLVAEYRVRLWLVLLKEWKEKTTVRIWLVSPLDVKGNEGNYGGGGWQSTGFDSG